MTRRDLSSEQVKLMKTEQKRVRNVSRLAMIMETESPAPQTNIAWRGWTIGAFVQVLRPRRTLDELSLDERVWTTGTALLLKISERDSEETEFHVARLHDRRMAACSKQR